MINIFVRYNIGSIAIVLLYMSCNVPPVRCYKDAVVVVKQNAVTEKKHESDYISDDLEDGYFPEKSCEVDADCASILPHLVEAYNMSSELVHAPICSENDNSSTIDEGTKMCSCGDLCLSKSLNSHLDEYMYYCGPCGRVGSECLTSSCTNKISECSSGYCECIENGVFQDLFNCIIPYYGYEIALQMALTACIVIAVCLLIATLYNYIWISRRRNGRAGRLARLLRRSSVVSQAPPNDTPPKYDDVVDILPSYQEALGMQGPGKTEGATNGKDNQQGITNPSFDDDSGETSLKPPPPYSALSEDQLPETPSTSREGGDASVDVIEIVSASSQNKSNNIETHGEAVPDEASESFSVNPTPIGGVIPKRKKRMAPTHPSAEVKKDSEETFANIHVENQARKSPATICPKQEIDSYQPIFKPLISEDNVSQNSL